MAKRAQPIRKSNPLRDKILTAEIEIPTEDVWVEEWEETITLRGLTGTERDRYEGTIIGDGQHRNYDYVRAGMVARSMVDKDGARVLLDEDIPVLGRQPARVLDKLFEVCQRLSGLRREDLEELRGNSDGAPSGAGQPN